MTRGHQGPAWAFGLLALLVAGCANANTPLSPARSAVSWSGNSGIETDRVELSGDYVARWTLTPVSAQVACVFGAYLWGTGANVATVTAISRQSDTTRVHGLERDRYYGKIIASCPWSLTLTPE